jgi:hypothetical protein
MGDNSAGDDASSRPHTTLSEQTPLLQSEASSRTSVEDSIPRGGNENGQTYQDDHANQTVTRGRGIAIGISMFLLIFLQCE